MNTDGKIHKSGFIDSNKVSSKHEPPEPCRTLPKPTPAEALELKIKLPWEDKVRRMRPADLTKELFIQLDEYGLTRTEIMNLFHCYQYDFYPLLKKWGIPPATPGGKKKALRSGNLEPVAPAEKPPMDLSRSYHDTAPGKARAARLAKGAEEEIDLAIRTEKELDAEMERIDKRLAELGCKPEPTQAAATDQDEDGLNYQDRHNLGIHAPTQTELEDVFRPDDEGQIDLGGWLEFQGGGQSIPVARQPAVGIAGFLRWQRRGAYSGLGVLRDHGKAGRAAGGAEENRFRRDGKQKGTLRQNYMQGSDRANPCAGWRTRAVCRGDGSA